MEINPTGDAGKPALTKQQKTGFALLLVFAILAVTLGVLNLRNTMLKPFALTSTVPLGLSEVVNDVGALRMRDTDHDKLNDFDELYVYSTSPYLADTDSDGLSDYDEVAKGTNPLCGEGKDCESDITNQSGLTKTSVGSASTTMPTVTTPDLAGNIDVLKMIQDPAQIRKMLIDGGIKKEDLDQIPDDVLMNAVAEQFGASLEAAGTTASST